MNAKRNFQNKILKWEKKKDIDSIIIYKRYEAYSSNHKFPKSFTSND